MARPRPTRCEPPNYGCAIALPATWLATLRASQARAPGKPATSLASSMRIKNRSSIPSSGLPSHASPEIVVAIAKVRSNPGGNASRPQPLGSRTQR